MVAPRQLIALGLLALVLGEGAFFEWDYASLLSGDPILVAILAAAIVLVVLTFVRPGRGLLLAAGLIVALIPVIVLFVFGAILEVADGGMQMVGVLAFLLALALSLPPAIIGFRQEAPGRTSA